MLDMDIRVLPHAFDWARGDQAPWLSRPRVLRRHLGVIGSRKSADDRATIADVMRVHC